MMRPTLFRQACAQPTASQRMLSTATSTMNRPLAQQLRPAFQRSAIPQSTRVAAFHATQRKQILPPLPQKIVGTANDPVPVPAPDYTHGSYHWSFERYGSRLVWENLDMCKRRAETFALYTTRTPADSGLGSSPLVWFP